MSGQDKSSKTHKPTEQRLRKAKEDGNVARSADIAAWFGLLAATFVLPMYMKWVFATATRHLNNLSGLRNPDVGAATSAASQAASDLSLLLLPPLVTALVAGVTISVAQTGFIFSPKALKPKLSNISPKSGIKKLFGKKTVWETGKQMFRLVTIALVAVPVVTTSAQSLTTSPPASITAAVDFVGGRLLLLVRLVALVGLVISLADFFFQKKTRLSDLKMSRHEVVKEQKDQDGDPLIKSMRRQKASEMAANRGLPSIADASVVVVNPSQYAAALHYDPAIGVPQIIDLGVDAKARSIRDEALAAGVPVIESRPIVRAIHRTGKKGALIPEELYAAVAVVLAFSHKIAAKSKYPVVHKLPAADTGFDHNGDARTAA